MKKNFVYPTNNFGHHNNVQYYYYSKSVTQGSYLNGYSVHQIQVRNQSDNVIQIVEWYMKNGRLQQDFTVKQVRPGLFYTARCGATTSNNGTHIVGAVTFKVKDKNQFYTFAFQDPFSDFAHRDAYKGHIQEGSDRTHAILMLKDCSNKQFPWGSYQLRESQGRGKSVIIFGRSIY